MRMILIAAGLCAAAFPAAAQSSAQRDVVRNLNEPMVQAGIAGMVGAVADILLDTRIAPITRHVGTRDGTPPAETLRDLQRRANPHFEAQLRDQTRRAVAVTGAIAGDALAMGDELQRTAARLQAILGPLAAMVESRDPADDN